MSQHDTLTLEHCPFCGAQPEQCDVGDHVVTCPSCGVDGPYGAPSGVAGAIQGWNRRAALSATQPAQAAQGEPDTDAHTLAHNMMMWVNDARQHNSEYVPVHVSTLEKMICYLSQKVASNGFVMVPKKCTEAMKDVGIQFEFATISDGRLLAQTMWNELLIAALQAPLQQAAQSEPVKTLFASKVAARKWAELQEQGARMQSIAFDGGKGGSGTIDPWGVVRWVQAAQGAGEVVYQYQNADGSWIDQQKSSYDYNVRYGAANVRVLYTQPAAGADVPDMVEIMALADSYRNATCQEATASAREWLRAAIAASGRKS